MKIIDYKLEIYKEILDRPLGDSNGPSGNDLIYSSILKIETDEGITGIAPLGNEYVKEFFPILENEDPREVFSIWKKMIDFVFKGGDEGEAHGALSAVDIALWDIKAKINSEPLWKTLGSNEPRCKVYASDIGYNLTDEELHSFFSKMAEKGVDSGKVKIGISLDDDIRRIGIMKEALSVNNPNPMLLIDSNEYWSPKQAIRFIREIEEHFDITWAEEPARRWDFIGLKKISDSVKTAVCAGENIDTLGEFLPYFHHQSADIIQVSSGMGGITCALQIADAAYGFDLPVTLGGSAGHLHAHLATSIPNFMIMEVSSEFPDPVLSTEIKFEEGNAILGNEPGIGFKINWDKLEDLKTENPSRVSGPSPYGRRSGAGLYQVKASPEEIKEAQEK